MKIQRIVFFALMLMFFSTSKAASDSVKILPDTVLTGIYITSIHDIDFKEKEYTVDLWLWMKYKRKEFDFIQNLEIPQAKTVTKSFTTIDTSGEKVYVVMKLQCVMKDNWKTNNFPFDGQSLRLSFENSQYDSSTLVFAVDTLGDHYDKKYALQGWNIDSCKIKVKTRTYKTTFGIDQASPQSKYSSYMVRIVLERESLGIFWKLFLGMYVAFLIAYACFFIHADSIDSRFGLSVGALFAVIGNKYVVDSSLPETTSFTLVDKLHQVTLVFILAVIIATAHTLKLVKQNKIADSITFDKICAKIFLILYTGFNTFFIWQAISNK